MNTEKLKIFCTEVAVTVRQSQGVQIFIEEVINDADMLYNYLHLNTLPKQIDEENEK